jgi:transcription-repair coupling factor (superfamily II helicase)
MYQKIAAIEDESDASDVLDELLDRYGDPPAEVNNLLLTAKVKALAAVCGFSSISDKGGAITMNFSKNVAIDMKKLSPLMSKYKRQVLFSAGLNPYLALRLPAAASTAVTLEHVVAFLKEYKL